MNPELWVAVVTAVFALIKDCQANKQPPEAIADQILAPRGMALVRLERGIRQRSGLSRRDWRKKRDAIMGEVLAEMRTLTRKDALELVEEADDAENIASVAAGFATLAPQRFPAVDIDLVTRIAQATEAARQAAETLWNLIKEAKGTIPGLGS